MAATPTGQPAVLVRKYGGSSLASVDRIRAVARDIAAQRAQGYRVVVVVSAMGRTTDELNHLAHQVSATPPRRELDMLLSVGERITMSLLSMALAAEGCPAISYTGSQCGIITDTSHTDARIVEVKADRVRNSLADGFVVVVAGFQGVSTDREITTLGRGGSDTTAVALAAALGAQRCEILKDVDGVYTADPHKVPAAHHHPALSYEQMKQVAAAGCGVIHARAIEFATEHGVPLFVGSSFQEGPGTLIGAGDPGPRDVTPGGAAVGLQHDPEHQPALATYRPLALIVQEDAGVLELSCAVAGPWIDPDGPPDDGERPDADQAARWRQQLANVAGAQPLLAEWYEESGTRLVWGAIAESSVLSRLHPVASRLASEPGTRLLYRRGCACVSIAGERPPSWVAVRERLAVLLAGLEMTEWWLRAEGSVVRLLVPAGTLPKLLGPLHADLFPA